MREPASFARPITAGAMTGLVGFTSAFVVVLTGLTAVGADAGQASSGLLAVSVTMGLASILLAVTTRLPIVVAWSTPGAALLAATGTVEGGWPAAVGAFLVAGVLIVITGLMPQVGALIARIPTSVAQAMLAGVLFQLCLGPIVGLASDPWAVAPVVIVWLLALRLAPRWASPLAFVTAAIVITIDIARARASVPASSLVPNVEFTTPAFTFAAIIGVALPLYLVTMASQNVPGVAIMRNFDFVVPWRRTMVVTGVGTMAGAPAGGHAINLAAITAALAAGPEAGEERSRRWVASVTSGAVVIVLGIASAAFGTLVRLAPEGVIAAVAGLALLGTFAASMKAALDVPGDQIPAAVTFVTAASGVAILGVSAAFWALVAGVAVKLLLGFRRRPDISSVDEGAPGQHEPADESRR